MFGGLVRILNSRFLLQYKHFTRVVWVCVAWIAGFVMFRFAYSLIGSQDTLGFALSLLSTVVIGSFTSIGDGAVIGFMKALPAENIAGWSSGTGIAGLTGTGFYLLCSSLGLKFDTMVLILMPFGLIYVFNFKLILNLKSAIDRKFEDAWRQADDKASEADTQADEAREAAMNAQLSMATIRSTLRCVGIPILNLSLVYFLEYACTTSFAERAHPKADEHADFLHRKAYVLLAMSYQLGVFLSRSSFYFFKVRRVWIMTYAQVFNFGVWLTIAVWRWLAIELQIPLMIFVGLMGGCSYVNCMFMILGGNGLSKSQKEVAVNVAGFFVDVGIVSAALFAIVVSNFLITNK